MPRKERPVKIKRYKRGARASVRRAETLKKVAVLRLVALLIIGAGILLGKPLVKLLTREKPDPSQDPSSAPSQTVSAGEREENSQDESNGPEEPGAPAGVAVKNRIYYYATVEELSSRRGIDSTVDRAAALGANCLIFDVKTKDGYVTFDTKNAIGSKLLNENRIDIPYLVEKLSEKGMAPVARMYTFMDQMVSTVERSTAVLYSGTEARWLDSSRDLGGKAWANPASSTMQQYIIELTDELMDLGVRDVIYAAFHTPTGYSLEYRDFGTSMEGVVANMTNLLKTLKGKLSAGGGTLILEVEYSAVDPNGSYAQYVVHPYQLGAGNLIITLTGSEGDIGAIAQTLSQTAAGDERIDSVTLWARGADAERTKALGSWFVN